MGPAGPPLLFCPFPVVWKVTVGVCSTHGHIQTVAECPAGSFLMSSSCAGYKKGCTPPHSPAVGAPVASWVCVMVACLGVCVGHAFATGGSLVGCMHFVLVLWGSSWTRLGTAKHPA